VQPSAAKRAPWWLWPTILSLDAPAVVVLWQELIARSASIPRGVPEAAVLASSVWLAYAADRWIEGWRLAPESILTHRHRFHQRWRWPMLAVWIVVLSLDVLEAARGLTAEEFRAGLVVLLPVAAYLLSHQLVHRRSRWRAPKEACVALLLGAGAAVFTVGTPGADLRAAAAPLGLFVLLCFSNCALISVWEDEVDRSHGQTSLALQFGRASALSRALPWVIAVGSAAVWLCGLTHARAAAACAAASGVLLGLVDIAEPRIGRVSARVLADVALLTPLLVFLAGDGR
jgi:4-hydroxybenzoate polyprenyltransferase